MRNARLIPITLAAACAATASAAGPAHAGQWICVPDAANAAVTSGGASGGCSSAATPVKLPATAADQQKLIDILPYLSFSSQGLPDSSGAGTPTITVRGANLQVTKKDATTSAVDGTGNIVLGEQEKWGSHAGSNNVILGWRNSWTGSSNLVVGEFNQAGGSENVVFGASNKVDLTRGAMSILGGSRNTASAYNTTIAGGYGRSATDFYGDQNRVYADGSGDDVHWIRYGADGKVIATSGPTTYTYSGSGYSLTGWKNVNLDKCTLTATAEGADGQQTTFVASPYYASYAYVRVYKPYAKTDTSASYAYGVAHSVVANCNRLPGATG